MDQEKIGKFIASCRKGQQLTQLELADKLNVTDRAISKWENGRGMPDSSIMLKLCDVLQISVNELLSGDRIKVEDYNKEMENKLLDLIKEKESTDRMLLKLEIFIGVLSFIIILVPTILAAYLPFEKDWVRFLVAISGFIPGMIGAMVALRIEQIAGYYKCEECGCKHVPTFLAINFAQHMGRTRKLKCPKCGKKSWQKKVISKY